jgi:chromosome segregation ATPase
LNENELKGKNQREKIIKLNDIKENLEHNLKQTLIELNELRIKFQTNSNLIENNLKKNTLLNEEKQSLELILQDNAVKLKTLKNDYDQLLRDFEKTKSMNADLKSNLDISKKKLNEINKMNRILSEEKDQYLKVPILRHGHFFVSL